MQVKAKIVCLVAAVRDGDSHGDWRLKKENLPGRYDSGKKRNKKMA